MLLLEVCNEYYNKIIKAKSSSPKGLLYSHSFNRYTRFELKACFIRARFLQGKINGQSHILQGIVPSQKSMGRATSYRNAPIFCRMLLRQLI